MNADSDEMNREFLAHMLPSQHSIRNFIFSLHPQAGDLDDIMQNTAVSLWEKFATFDQSREFLPWAMRMAYFEVLRFRKKCSRERLVFCEELLEVMAGETAGPDLAEPVRQALEGCLSRLDPRLRMLVEARYAQGTSITALARSTKQSVHRLYRQLEKVRAQLVTCVKREMADEDHGLKPHTP